MNCVDPEFLNLRGLCPTSRLSEVVVVVVAVVG